MLYVSFMTRINRCRTKDDFSILRNSVEEERESPPELKEKMLAMIDSYENYVMGISPLVVMD